MSPDLVTMCRRILKHWNLRDIHGYPGYPIDATTTLNIKIYELLNDCWQLYAARLSSGKWFSFSLRQLQTSAVTFHSARTTRRVPPSPPCSVWPSSWHYPPGTGWTHQDAPNDDRIVSVSPIRRFSRWMVFMSLLQPLLYSASLQATAQLPSNINDVIKICFSFNAV